MTREEILKHIELALKGELNDIMSDSRPLPWRKVEERNKEIMKYLEDNLS